MWCRRMINENDAILPGSTIGILGSGQLGRMLAMSARQHGYRVHVYSPGVDTPAGQLADHEWSAPYDDLDSVRAFAKAVDVITYEFENVPAATAEVASSEAPLRPGPQALHVAQHRLREKSFFRDNGLPVAPFAPVRSEAELTAAVESIGVPAVLKTASSGYDGKGQVKIEAAEDALAAWERIGRADAILEAWVTFEKEVSVVGCRGIDGTFRHFGLIENEHVNHILDVSIAPADAPAEIAQTAIGYARTVLEALDVVGVLCVEFFLRSNGALLLNEIAPRPHNSGHLTIEGCVASQFEQQLRAICGLPLGETRYDRHVAMVNLLGDLWQDETPCWPASLGPDIHLHLYGKQEPRVGRKMGHITALADSSAEAVQRAREARKALLGAN